MERLWPEAPFWNPLPEARTLLNLISQIYGKTYKTKSL